MEGEAERSRKLLATKKLYEAALEGDLPSLLNLLREDPFILNRYILEKPGHFSQSPLHVATSLGHLEFTKEILHQKPELAEELDFSKRWSPLHIASSKGYLEIAQALLTEKPNMCFARDQDGLNPVHVAAINGQIHVLGELVRARLQAARERANGGESILHLCVKFSQLEALKCLLDAIDAQLVNSKDMDGNTVLHLAVATKQPEIMLDYPLEYITGIRGKFSSSCIVELEFVTNKRSCGSFGCLEYNSEMKWFKFQFGPQNQFGGFYGSHDSKFLTSIGVYFKPLITIIP